ncbi:MAG: TraG family conjugative transposon ATPase, partial [Pedobacter sp.]
YTDKNPITMNPFRITEAEYNIEKKDFLCTLIGLTWKGAEGTFNPVERDVIANVISAYYLKFFADNGDLKFDTFYEFALVKIPEIKAEERIVFDFDEFRYVLKKFYKGGEFASILNKAADKSLFTERFIVFEIDSIKEHKILFPIVTLIIMDVFIQKMRYRSDRRKTLIVEEAWKAIASPLMAGYLLYLYKTVRKFWGEAIVVTQELGDIIGNAVVKDSIINNSDTICLLDQTKFKDNYKEIAALLSINETERRKIFTINQLDNTEGRGRFKEVYIRRGAVGEVYGVEVSMFQYLTFTTEKPEKTAVESYVARFGSYPAGLEAFISDLSFSGLGLAGFVKQVNAE